MRQQKQLSKEQKRLLCLKNQLNLSYMITSRRAGVKKNMDEYKQRSFLTNDFHSSRKKTSISFFKQSMATINNGFWSSWIKKKSKNKKRENEQCCIINPELKTVRKKFIEDNMKTQGQDNNSFNIFLGNNDTLLRNKPFNSFRSKYQKFNYSIHKNNFMTQKSPYITLTNNSEKSKRIKSQPDAKFISIPSKKINFNKYEYIKQLGTGGYARVVLVKKINQNNKYYAVKIYDKQQILLKSKVTNVHRQVKIMYQIFHKNICRIQQQYENKQSHYIVMQYCGTKSLSRKIEQSYCGYFSERQAKRYFMKILKAFIYLHEKRIVHRDVKADNILIYEGDIKLIDFGFSVIPNQNNLVDSYCGTLAYMAPEIYNRTPYNPFQAQVWSLGILLYLMLQGVYPFLTSKQDQSVYKIKKRQLKFISPLSQQAKKLINSMLCLIPSHRITLKQIEQHQWFKQQSL